MNNLKKLRKLVNKTQQEVADELNMPRTKYARYELTTAEPNKETLFKLADYYKVTIDTLLGHEVPYLLDKSSLSKSQRDLIDLIITMTDRQCESVYAFACGVVEGEEAKLANIERLKKRFE